MNKELTQHECPKVFRLLKNGFNQNVFTGAQFGLWSEDYRHHFYHGFIGEKHQEEDTKYPQGENRLITSQTIFDISSLTKVISTTTLCALLVERGWLQFHAPVQKFFPQKNFSGMEIQHLLSHTAGLIWWKPYFEELQKEFLPEKIEFISIEHRQKKMRELVLSTPLEREIGKEAVYSDLSMMLLGFIIEDIFSEPLDEIFDRFIAQPLGLKNTYFKRVHQALPYSINSNAAATENSLWRGGVLEGVVHDDNCYAMGGYAGHAGLFSNALDLLKFVEALNRGFLTKKTLLKLWSPYLGLTNCTRTLGWDTPSSENSSTGQMMSKRSVGHLGFTGTSLWIDLEKNIALTLLTNRVYPTRENLKIKEFRPLFHDAILSDWNMLK